MKTLYQLLLESKYEFVRFDKNVSYTIKLVDGEWEKQITIRKSNNGYEVNGFEGTENFIKTFNCKFKTYKEVANYLGV